MHLFHLNNEKMIKEKQNISASSGEPTLLRDAVINRIRQQINQKGIDEAKNDFIFMDKWFSMLPEWPFIAAEVFNIFNSKKSEANL
ncbi:hypothetical protein SAMN04488494_0594 [Xylanibacter ruminicola]|uniref:Uncharacterized protein n=2 Tax=Xylanibacter ruminicola TaxID=839 RepID=A0A1M7D1E5_XYLRU|nr:hypothetical protein SAMN04488494_0594 [Xylanibacter ruminicola]